MYWTVIYFKYIPFLLQQEASNVFMLFNMTHALFTSRPVGALYMMDGRPVSSQAVRTSLKYGVSEEVLCRY